MTTLADEGWTAVTPRQSDGEYTWQLFCDTRRPPIADLVEPEPWPQDAEFLSWWIEATDREGREMSGGSYGLRDPDEEVRYSTSSKTGFPQFVEVRFAEGLDGVTVDTDQRAVFIGAADLEPHFGMRFHAFPLREGETVTAVHAGEIRLDHIPIPEGSGTGFTPF